PEKSRQECQRRRFRARRCSPPRQQPARRLPRGLRRNRPAERRRAAGTARATRDRARSLRFWFRRRRRRFAYVARPDVRVKADATKSGPTIARMKRALILAVLLACSACHRASAPKRPVVGVSLLTETHTF